MARFARLARLQSGRLARIDRPAYAQRVVFVEQAEPAARKQSGSDKSSRRPPHSSSGHDDDAKGGWKSRLLEGGATAFGSVVVLGLIGYSYEMYYKWLVLQKMDKAFDEGYSTPELAALTRHTYANLGRKVVILKDMEDDNWISRQEQGIIDAIVDGTSQGQYHLITGEKGTGKTSMLLKAMRRIEGKGIAMLEAHGDLEVFRLRLGKALNYDFHEDYIGSLFSFKGPRDATPLLDIERAFNKMEKIALRRRQLTGKPLLLIINRAHLLRDDDEGRHLLEAIQQRAELWAASMLVTVVFISDEYWIEERLRPHATRMRVLPVHDISRDTAVDAIKEFRARVFHEKVTTEAVEKVYARVGGRLRFISQVAKAVDMDRASRTIVEREKQWFLNQCWILGKEMDPEAEKQQDFCMAAMVLAKALVAKEDEMKKDGTISPFALPELPLHEARQIMTRFDFIQAHDHINIFSIDSNSKVRADSVAMQNVFREVVNQEGFQELLDETQERLDELEALGRTREITLKDLVGGGGYNASVKEGSAKQANMVISFRAAPDPDP
ncbi:unnamed protein product [Clonostachys chloroleuca]|uniref:Orc1-like AAA ATPase domain-containing protein n=1 Tax=Clonostachys chloroleuca TaxID=1926264 RepID=A0AA35QD59_9HYPO|nr:unnamed protein product [Clonostachys chloroleuca]